VEAEFGFIPAFRNVETGARYPRLCEAVQNAGAVTLDFPALNVFFRLGMFLNAKTPFREIRRCNPEPVFVPPAMIAREAAMEAYIDLFRQAVRRRAVPNSTVALSGGCDSRHILLELHSQKRLPGYAVTVAIPGRPSEVCIAQELAARTGVRHEIHHPQPSRAVEDEVWKNRACDFMSLQHGWFAGVGKERDGAPWWDGIGGDVLSAGLFLGEWNLKLFQENRLDELAERLIAEDAVPYFRDQALFPRIDALAEVRDELAKHREAPNPVGSFYFWNRTRVCIAAVPYGLLATRHQNTLAPYLDRDLWKFLASLPAPLLVDHQFHRDTVKRAYPEFAGIPFFEEKVKPARRIQRIKAACLVQYLVFSRAPDLKRILTALRAARAFFDAGDSHGLDSLLAAAVYCTQIERLAIRPA
jgi:hypothetical protein